MSGLWNIGPGGAPVFLILLLDVAFKGAVLLALAAVVVPLLRRGSAAARHLVWALALTGTVALPLVCLTVPSWSLPLLPQVRAPAAILTAIPAPEPADRHGGSTPGDPVIPETSPSAGRRMPVALPPAEPPGAAPHGAGLADEARTSPAPEALSTAAPPPWRPVYLIGFLWLAGALACLLPYLLGSWKLHRWCREARPPDAAISDETRRQATRLGLARSVRVLIRQGLDVPFTWGFRRPVLLLPQGFSSWPSDRRRTVLQHELAHIRRHDCLTQLLGRVGLALHWFNPLAWLAERRLRVESERACDDIVLRAGSRPADYASCLIEVARTLTRARRAPACGIAMARSGSLERRLLAIVDVGRRRGDVPSWARRASVALAFSLLLPVAALRLTERTSAASEAEPDPSATVSVALDGTADFDSIQAAVDAAPPGALVRIGPGEYRESVKIAKPLILEGAGWDRTVVTAVHVSVRLDDPAIRAEIEGRMRAATTDADRRAIRDQLREEFAPAPTILIEGSRDVTLRNLKATLEGRGDKGSVGDGAILELRKAAARVDECIFAGSPAHGVVIPAQSSLEMHRCLVAGVWGSGILVEKGPREGRVEVTESDIRNCRHRGIQIGAGRDSTVIERCRLSGSSWHGLRYDDSAPRITGNLFFDNERTAIYASGATSATLRGNLFYGGDLTCWFRNRDTIEGNTFVAPEEETDGDKDEWTGVSVLGASRPEIRGNIFFGLTKAIAMGNIGDDSPYAKSAGKIHPMGNIFWRNGLKVAGPSPEPDVESAVELPLDPEAGNLEVAPGFVDPGHLDFALEEESVARKAKIGAADHLSFESPWPLQPEEGAIRALRDEEEQERILAARAAEARSLAKPWIEDALQIQDRATRDAAVRKIYEALASGDPALNHAGLRAFLGTVEASYDKAPFRAVIQPLVEKLDGDARVSALYALRQTGKQPGDLELVLHAIEEDPSRSMRHSATHLLELYTGGKIRGRAAEITLALLQADDRDDRREALRGLWGADVTPELQERMIELAAPGSPSRHDAIYFGLSTLQGKSEAVLQALFKACEDPDSNNSHRAVWGLGHGVPEENQGMVADFAIDLLEARGSASVRKDCLRMLEQYGSARHVPALEALAQNDLLGRDLREMAERAAGNIQARERDRAKP